jgi:hypothetical protein
MCEVFSQMFFCFVNEGCFYMPINMDISSRWQKEARSTPNEQESRDTQFLLKEAAEFWFGFSIRRLTIFQFLLANINVLLSAHEV